MAHIQDSGFCDNRVLEGSSSQDLQERLEELIGLCRQMAVTGTGVMFYLAAWSENSQDIWYEYVPSALPALLGCRPEETAVVLRRSMLERRVYRVPLPEAEGAEVVEEVVAGPDLADLRHQLREQVCDDGLAAIYRVGTDRGDIWLKDMARVEVFSEDRISLSFGSLTDVSPEMRHKDFLDRTGYLDELTMLPKRVSLERFMEMKIGDYERGNIPDFSLLMIDIDSFKQINDSHGHQAGDLILQEFARSLANSVRKEDAVGRYGGDEFYGLCQGGVARAVLFAERLRRKIEATDFVYWGQRVPLTVSIGAAAASELEKLSMDNLIRLADSRLYQAKNSGRNRVWGPNP